jgi:hypothetical protein
MNKTNETILRILALCIAAFLGFKALQISLLIAVALVAWADYGAHTAAQLLAH